LAAARYELNRTRYADVKSMHGCLSDLAAAIAYVDAKGGSEATLEAGPTRAQLRNFAKRRRRPCSRPTALVLTMADRVQRVIDSSESVDPRLKSSGGLEFDIDPTPVAMHFRPDLVHRLSRGFRWWKIDFATAWHGHDGGDRPNTDLAAYGLDGLVSWFAKARREAARELPMAPGGSRSAVFWRSLLKPEFAAAWRRRVERAAD
jgi:hypothetical protein